MLWSFDKPAEEWASRSPTWKQSQSLLLRKTLLITFWRRFVTGRPHCKVKSHVCIESSAKEFPSGYKTGQRIPGSPSLQRKLIQSPQMHTKKNNFPSTFLNLRHLFLPPGRLHHYFQSSHLSPISTRQLVPGNSLSPASTCLQLGMTWTAPRYISWEQPFDNLHTEITPGSLPASPDRPVDLSSFWRRHCETMEGSDEGYQR